MQAANQAWQRLRKILCSRTQLDVRKRIAIWRATVVPTMTYGLAATAPSLRDLQRIQHQFTKQLRAITHLYAHLSKVSTSDLHRRYAVPTVLDILHKEAHSLHHQLHTNLHFGNTVTDQHVQDARATAAQLQAWQIDQWHARNSGDDVVFDRSLHSLNGKCPLLTAADQASALPLDPVLTNYSASHDRYNNVAGWTWRVILLFSSISGIAALSVISGVQMQLELTPRCVLTEGSQGAEAGAFFIRGTGCFSRHLLYISQAASVEALEAFTLVAEPTAPLLVAGDAREGPTGPSEPTEASVPQTQFPWQAIPRFTPGSTDVSEYSQKVKFLAAIWPREHLSLLGPRMALLCEGTAFKKIPQLPPQKLQANDSSGVELIVTTLGGSWGQTQVEKRYEYFERAIYGTVQKGDETNDSYLVCYDVIFDELISQGVKLEEFRAYILLRQSGLTAEDRKKIVMEHGGNLEYKKICSAIRLLGSRFFGELQGGKTQARTKTYDVNLADNGPSDEDDPNGAATTPAYTAFFEDAENDLDYDYVDALVSQDDPDAVQVASFETELEEFFQETPELQTALISYLDARQRLKEKQRNRGFWGPGSQRGKGGKGKPFGKGGGKGKKGR
ncbi:unnamed protein product [Symbiodinium sp. CCMP2592]|nr:unnamed protein product [Symbiodinium sp. CCMP2592]